MSTATKATVSQHTSEHGTLRSYTFGFVASLVCTVAAYTLVVGHNSLSHTAIFALVVAFAFVEFIVQLLFFLHLGKETRPRWKLFVFLFMIMVILILVFGSLWIMDNLNYRMTPEQMNTYMNNQGGGF